MKKKLIALAICLAIPFAAAHFLPYAEFTPVSAATITENGFTITDGIVTGYSGEETALVIPDSATKIGSGAFNNKTGITSVTIPNTVTEIGNSAFSGCTALQTVTMSDNVDTIGEYAFRNCTSLRSLRLSEGTVTIGRYAFIGCSSLGALSLPDSVVDVGDHLFSGCVNLTDVTLGKGVRAGINVDTFENCGRMHDITVIEGNPAYSSNGGVLFNRTGEKLIFYPHGRTDYTYAIPETTKIIGERSFYGLTALTEISVEFAETVEANAFAECTALTSVSIGNTVKSIGYRAFYNDSKIETLSVGNAVESIGGDAFRNCSSITSLTLYHVQTIGASAFQDCAKLATVSIGNDITSISTSAFYNNTALKNLTLGNQLEVIGSEAFRYCTSLTNVTIPDSTYQIDNHAFSGCSNLRSVTFGSSLESIGNYAFSSTALTSVTVPSLVTSLPTGIFRDCQKLTSVTLPETLLTIKNEAFMGCVLLLSIDIPNGVVSIGDNALRSCAVLKNIAIPDSVETMGASVLAECSALQSATMPKDMEVLPSYTFYNCQKLTSVTLPTALLKIDTGAFEGCKIFPSIEISDGVTSIGDHAFEGCERMTSVTLPVNLTSIGHRTFANCVKLPSIVIPNKVITIGGEAFDNCQSLATVTLSNSLKTVRYRAFRGCASLETIAFPDTVTTFEYEVLANCIELKTCTLPVAITTLPGGTFYGDIKLSTFTVPEKITVIGSNAFNGCVTLSEVFFPPKLEIIENGAFRSCAELHNFTLPDTLTTIGDEAFRGCATITEVNLPESLTTMGSSVFRECAGLLEVTIPSKIAILRNSTFEECSYLERVNLPVDLVGIESFAFFHCRSLVSINIPEKVASLGEGVFQGCNALTHIDIPDSVTEIGNRNFKECIGLKTAKLPALIKYIPNETFNGCIALTAVTMPNATEVIGDYAFYNCNSLRSIDLSEPLVNVKYCAFANCKSLKSVKLPSTIKVLGSYAFETATSVGLISLPATFEEFNYHSFYDNATVTDVYFGGDEETWNNLIRNKSLFNTTLRMHYGTEYPGPTLTSLAVATYPTKTQYTVGQTFDPEGLTLLATYDDRSTEIISEDIVCSTGALSKPSLQQVQASYGGKTAYFTIRVFGDIAITAQPEDTTAVEGEIVTFAVAADGENLTYQWYFKKVGALAWSKWNGHNTATTTAKANATWDGMQVYCLIKDTKDHSVSSNAVTLTIAEHGGPIITQQPESQTIELGDELTVSVAAEGENLTYQWYFKKQGAAVWSKWNGRTHATETVTPNASWDGIQLYCTITDADSTIVDSAIATITVGEPHTSLAITAQPQSQNINLGSQLTISVEAEGDDLTYQWFFKKKGANRWTIWKNHNKATEKVIPNATWDGMQLYCAVTDYNEDTITSEIATITIIEPQAELVIIKQPESQEILLGDELTVSVEADGDNVTYQWYYMKKGATAWTKWNNRTNATEKVTPNATWDGIKLYCVVSDSHGKSLDSEVATITFGEPEPAIKITSQPQNVNVPLGSEVKPSVVAEGDGLSYQWYFMKKGATTWTKWNNRTNATEKVTPNATWDGIKLYCTITDSQGNALDSDIATVTLSESETSIKITSQPQNVNVPLGSEVTLSVVAEGDGLTYQWYFMKKGATTWTKWNGRTHATEKVTPNATWDGIKLYCTISDSKGNKLNSDTATVTFSTTFAITQQPQNASIALGSEVTLSVKATGSNLTYQWYFMKKGATAWSKWNGRTHATEKVTPNESWDGIKLYCVVKDGSGNTLDSNVATITFVQQSSQLKITQHPSNVTAAAGENVSFVVKATGEGELTYQWYIKKVNGDWKAWTGHTTPTTSATTNSTWNGMQIYCTVTDGNGNSVTSNAATITIY